MTQLYVIATYELVRPQHVSKLGTQYNAWFLVKCICLKSAPTIALCIIRKESVHSVLCDVRIRTYFNFYFISFSG